MVVLIFVISVANGSMLSNVTKTSADFFRYVNVKDMRWDVEGGYWRPVGTVGDRYA